MSSVKPAIISKKKKVRGIKNSLEEVMNMYFLQTEGDPLNELCQHQRQFYLGEFLATNKT